MSDTLPMPGLQQVLLPATGSLLLLEKTADTEVGKGAFQEQQKQTTHPSLVHTQRAGST